MGNGLAKPGSIKRVRRIDGLLATARLQRIAAAAIAIEDVAILVSSIPYFCEDT